MRRHLWKIVVAVTFVVVALVVSNYLPEATPGPDPVKFEEGTPPIAEAEDNGTQNGGSEQYNRIQSGTDLTKAYPGLVFRYGSPSQPTIALTFDDGPDNTYTPAMLNILRDNGVKGTFFVTGVRAEQYPAVMRRIVNEGHALASHGYSHVNFANLSSAEIRANLEQNASLIRNAGASRTDMFRPPYGALDQTAINAITGAGYKIILWNVDSLDWKSLSQQQIADNVIPYVQNGSIILQHSAGESTQNLWGSVNALSQIIKTLKGRGYRFVTVPQLLNLDAPGAPVNWYEVQPGDTLWVIAQRTGSTVARLLDLNPGLDANYLYVGQRIRVSGSQTPSNPSNATTHTVKPGDTLWKIAQQYNTTVARLKELNPGLDPANLYPGLSLRVSGGSTAPTGGATYTVQSGDTFWGIAQKNNTSISRLKELNPSVNPNNLRVGQTIKLPGGSNGGQSQRTHTVAAGESLWTIARKYNTTVAAIANANGLSTTSYLRIGQTLVIP